MNMDKQQKPAFLFYASNMDVVSAYPEEDQRKIIMWILQYGFTGETPDCPRDMQDVLTPIFYGIDVQRRRYQNIEKINKWMAKLQRLTANQTDEIYTVPLNKAFAQYKKLIVLCQKSDIPENMVTMYLKEIRLPSSIEHLVLGSTEAENDKKQQRDPNHPYGLPAR